MDLHTHLTYTELDVPQALTVNPAHAALRGVERLHAFIGSGITSVRDTSSFGTVPFILKAVGPGQPAPGTAGLRRRATDHRDRRPQRRGAVHPLRGVRSGRRGVGGRRIPGGGPGAVQARRRPDQGGEPLQPRGDRGGGGRGAYARPPDHGGLGDRLHRMGGGGRRRRDRAPVAAHRRSRRHDGAARDRLGADGRPLRLHLRVDGQLPQLDVPAIRAHRRNDPRDAAER